MRDLSIQEGAVHVTVERKLGYFDVEVSSDSGWMTLNDHVNFIVGGNSMESSSQSRRRTTVQSSMYDGDWEVHSVAAGVNEQITVDIIGNDSLKISENIVLLSTLFTQRTYNVRITRDQVQETWTCFPAEWQLNRGQIQSHNIRAQMQLTIPRFPQVSYEALI